MSLTSTKHFAVYIQIQGHLHPLLEVEMPPRFQATGAGPSPVPEGTAGDSLGAERGTAHTAQGSAGRNHATAWLGQELQKPSCYLGCCSGWDFTTQREERCWKRPRGWRSRWQTLCQPRLLRPGWRGQTHVPTRGIALPEATHVSCLPLNAIQIILQINLGQKAKSRFQVREEKKKKKKATPKMTPQLTVATASSAERSHGDQHPCE